MSKLQIRCRHNYSSYTLSSEESFNKRSIVGNSVLIERGLDDAYMPFGGFITDTNLAISDALRVKILNIEAFKLDDDPCSAWMELAKNSKVEGVKLFGRYCVLYKESELLLAQV